MALLWAGAAFGFDAAAFGAGAAAGTGAVLAQVNWHSERATNANSINELCVFLILITPYDPVQR